MKQRINAILPIAVLCLGGALLFAFDQRFAGYMTIAISLLVAYRDKPLFKDLSLVAIGLAIISLVPVTTDISYSHMILMAVAMTAAVVVPYLISKSLYKRNDISFPMGLKEPWGWQKWSYLGLVLLIGYFVLPLYLITLGIYVNWPAANSDSEVFRLFLGTNALGIWDELFFICTVFVLFHKHLSFWQANLLQATLFTSFLYDLGFTGIGPLMIYLFALTQGYIFKKTHSLFYLLCVHLLFDFILFLVLIHAHNREFLPIFLY